MLCLRLRYVETMADVLLYGHLNFLLLPLYYLDFCYRNGKTDAKNYIVEWYGKMEVAQDKYLVIGKYCKDCYTR